MLEMGVLGIPIKADDAQAMASFTRVETAGKQLASTLTLSTQQASGALKMLGIEARTASVNGVERVVVSALQLEQANGILARMAPNMKAVAIEATRAAQATQQVATATRAASTATVASGSMSSAVYQKWGNAAIRASGALMLLDSAMSGNDRSMQNLLRTGSSIAFMFGPQGAIVGALGLGASMIVAGLEKSKEAIRKTREETDKLIESARQLTSMPGFASLGGARQQSVSMGIRIAGLQDQLDALETLEQQFQQSARSAVAAGIEVPLTRSFDPRQIASLRTQIALLRDEKTQVDKLVGAWSTYEANQKKADDTERAGTAVRKDAARAIEQEAGWLAKLHDLGAITIPQVSRARELELQYTAALKDQSLTIEQQIALIEKRNAARDAQGVSFDLGRVGGDTRRGESTEAVTSSAATGAAAAVARNVAITIASVEQSGMNALEKLGASGASAFAGGFANSLDVAFENLFGGNLFGGIEELGKGLLATFGRMLQQFGAAALAANKWMMGIFAALGTPAGAAAAIGLIGLGSALVALGGRGGGSARGGGGHRGGWGDFSAGSGSAGDALGGRSLALGGASTENMQARPTIVFAPTILGAADPAVPRFLADGLNEALARGMRLNLAVP